jgi:hypothetical protein
MFKGVFKVYHRQPVSTLFSGIIAIFQPGVLGGD